MSEQFVQQYFLKKGEVVDKVERDGELLILHIMKKTNSKVAQYKITTLSLMKRAKPTNRLKESKSG